MSFEYYSKWWATAKTNLQELIAKDEFIRKTTKEVKDRSLANQLLGGLYSKYSLIVQDVGTCLDQMCQPQKRITVRKLLDAAVVRLSELNDELRKIDISEYHYIDGALIELKLVPQHIEILQPPLYYPRTIDIQDICDKNKRGEILYVAPEVPEVIVDENQNIVDITNSMTNAKEPSKSTENINTPKPPEDTKEPKKKKRPKKYVPEEIVLTDEEKAALRKKEILTINVNLIQAHERGRQARLYYFDVSSVQRTRKANAATASAPEKPENTQLLHDQNNSASTTIQRVWKGHVAREFIKREENQRRLLIGMTEPSWKSTKELDTLKENIEKRQQLRDQRIREYIEANLSEKVRVYQIIGPRLMEDIGDEIREWFYQWYIRAKNFDKYPPVEKGGTILVVRGETMTPEEWIEEVERKRREKVKNKGKDKAKEKELKRKAAEKKKEEKRKAKEKAKKEKLKAKKKKKKFNEFEFKFENTISGDYYNKGTEEYVKFWNERRDVDNPLEKHYMDIITDEKCYEMQLDVREQVDELMRLELEMLENALEDDKIRMKGKKGKKKKKKKKKNKKKKRKKKGKKDPTGNRTTEDLFQELVDNKIIQNYPLIKLESYKGDFSYNNWEKRSLTFDPPATLGDVRQVVNINCIIPMSVELLKKSRSVLIMGPRQSGKHLLANAIFNETHSVLFNLSPEITAGKYPGKKGMKMLLHLINKMSRLLQPTIIFFDGAEKIFYKKVPKEEKPLDPKRLGKKLYKGIVKTIKPEDKVLVLGITGKPWTAQAKLKKTFEKVILIPRPDYGSIYLYWRELLMPYHGIDRNFNVSNLTKLTLNYPLSTIRDIVKTVLQPNRIIQLKYKPLKEQELYEVLLTAQLEPITDKEYGKFQKWYNKTPLGKERSLFNKFAEAQREAEARQLEKAKQKK